MVVHYASGSEGSMLSFFTTMPRVVFFCKGSAVPLVLPQMLITMLISGVAVILDIMDSNPFQGMDGQVSLGILVSFLLVFKTQNSYGQFWQALDSLENVLQLSRSVAMTACAIFNWDKTPKVQLRVRKIVRLLLLHYFVMVEHFQRTGANEQTKNSIKDDLREHIRRLATDNEFEALYPNELVSTKGSQSLHASANPATVLFWVQLLIARVHDEGAVPAPVVSGLANQIQAILKNFSVMNRIDKVQFPFPYAQIVKILTMFWVFSLPFNIVTDTKLWTPVLAGLAALGFFGLDEVAEILESPFGNDPNDIHLPEFGTELLEDLEMIYHGRGETLNIIGDTSEEDLDFSELLEGYFLPKQTSGSDLSRASRMKSIRVTMDKPFKDLSRDKLAPTDSVDLELGSKPAQPLAKDGTWKIPAQQNGAFKENGMFSHAVRGVDVELLRSPKQQGIAQSIAQNIAHNIDIESPPAAIQDKIPISQDVVQGVSAESLPATVEGKLAKLQGLWHDSRGHEIRVEGRICWLDDNSIMLLIEASQITFNGWSMVNFASENKVVQWQRDGDLMVWCSVDAPTTPQKHVVVTTPEYPTVATATQIPTAAPMGSQSRHQVQTTLESEDDDEILEDSDYGDDDYFPQKQLYPREHLVVDTHKDSLLRESSGAASSKKTKKKSRTARS